MKHVDLIISLELIVLTSYWNSPKPIFLYICFSCNDRPEIKFFKTKTQKKLFYANIVIALLGIISIIWLEFKVDRVIACMRQFFLFCFIYIMAEMLLLKHFFLKGFEFIFSVCLDWFAFYVVIFFLLFISYGFILNQRGSKVNRRSWIVDILYVFLFLVEISVYIVFQ